MYDAFLSSTFSLKQPFQRAGKLAVWTKREVASKQRVAEKNTLEDKEEEEKEEWGGGGRPVRDHM